VLDVPPLHPSAEAALDTLRAWTLRELAAALLDPPEGEVAGLVARLDLAGTRSAEPIDPAALREAAARESELLGDIRVRCEHLLLGALRALGAQEELDRARADFQLLRGERAFGAYEQLKAQWSEFGAARPSAVMLAGIPGTGKSTLAESLGRELRAPVFSMDWQLGALVPFGVLRPDTYGPMADLMITASLARQLQLGLNVVIDATSHQQATRKRWQSVTESLGAVFLGVECICSDQLLHRARIENRSRGIPHWPGTVSWNHVHRMRDLWQCWPEPHLVIDSATTTPDESLHLVLDALTNA
jgi:predicted kinase